MFNFSISDILAGLLFGIVGMYLIKSGIKDGNLWFIIIGFVLCIYPYFISNEIALWGIGIFLSGLAYQRRYG